MDSITTYSGIFIKGKQDQLLQDSFFNSSLVQALKELIIGIISRNEVEKWREKLLEQLGINAQIIVDGLLFNLSFSLSILSLSLSRISQSSFLFSLFSAHPPPYLLILLTFNSHP